MGIIVIPSSRGCCKGSVTCCIKSTWYNGWHVIPILQIRKKGVVTRLNSHSILVVELIFLINIKYIKLAAPGLSCGMQER